MTNKEKYCIKVVGTYIDNLFYYDSFDKYISEQEIFKTNIGRDYIYEYNTSEYYNLRFFNRALFLGAI